MLQLFKPKHKSFFSTEDQEKIIAAVKTAEHQTSGEVRVYVESKCSYMDALHRAQEIFFQLHMDKTALRNAVLVYIAVKDKQAALFADEGIHTKTGKQYWLNAVAAMLLHFKQERLTDGVCHAVLHIGEALQSYFPHDEATDKNELPDDIVFGK